MMDVEREELERRARDGERRLLLSEGPGKIRAVDRSATGQDLVMRKIRSREVSVHMSQPAEGKHRVRLVHRATGVEGHGEGQTLDSARAAADQDFAAHLEAAGLELVK